MKSIKAKVINGIITPEEELDIEDGTEVLVIIEEPEKAKINLLSFERAAGAWKDAPELGEEFIKYIYEKREAISTREVPKL